MLRKKFAIAVTVGALIGAAGIAGVADAGGPVTQISGTATLAGGDGSGECGGKTSLLTLVLVGDLDGCWYTDDAVATVTPSGVVNEGGAETFVGTWMGESITFTTVYKFTAKFDAAGNEIHGRCQHPIVGGDVDGRVDFKDDVDTGIFDYRGHLRG
jgi:hypothetical protein